MTRRTLLSWTVLSAVAAAFLLFLLQWRAEREELRTTLARVHGVLVPLRDELEGARVRLGALGEGLRGCRRALRDIMGALGSMKVTATVDPSRTAREAAETPSDLTGVPEPDEEDPLEALRVVPPETYTPHALMEKEIADILGDEAINPSKRELDRVEYAEVELALAKAKSRIQVLSSEIQLTIAEAVETLGEQGEYTEYLRGDPPPRNEDPRVLSVGVAEDGGVIKLYWLYPEEFPEVYKKREERDAVAKRAVGEIMAIVQSR